MKKIKTFFNSNWGIVIILAVGFALRLLAAARGHNFDFESFALAADISSSGGNVYASTTRYNYGPVWFLVLHALNLLSFKDPQVLRFTMAGFLSLVDVGIFFVLLRRLGMKVACLFYLNPISIIITGYHTQFGNFALLVGMLAVIIFGDDKEARLSRRKILGLLVLGLSLAVKHILFLFPLWLAARQKGLLNKAAVLLVPTAVFALSFLPYWNEGKQGIIQNVLLYSSKNNEYFYRLYVPQSLQYLISSRMVWVMLLGFFAFFFRKRGAFESLLFYTSILVWASPSIANQYLAIPLSFTAAYFNPFNIAYTAVGTWYLFIDKNGLHLPLVGDPVRQGVYYAILVSLLCLGFITAVWSDPLRDIYKKVVREIRVQLGLAE